jgi:cytidylate kinase
MEGRQEAELGTEEQKLAVRAAILEEMRERDRRDRNRAESPLRAAEDAVILDSTAMTLEQVLAEAERIVREHLGG